MAFFIKTKNNLIRAPLNIKRILFIFSFLIFNANCCIKIPFEYFPSKLNDNINPKNIIVSLLDLTMYGLLEIGTPKQKIQIPIRFGSNTFFLPQKSSYHYNIDNNLNLYDDNISSTFSKISDLDFYEGENFQEAFYVNDIFYFQNETTYLDFYLSTSYFFPQMGGLGLQLYPSNDMNSATPSIDKTFLAKLKLKGLINNYIWSIFYCNDANQTLGGYILVGDYPLIYDNYSINNDLNYSLNSIEAEIYDKIVQTKFTMDNAFAFYENEKNIIKEINIGNNIINVRLDYDFGGILAPIEIMNYLDEKIFKNNNLCYKEEVLRITKNIFYYCQNNNNMVNKLKKSFPIIKFENKILNSSFYINIDDLIVRKDRYIYILLIFEEKIESNWVLGIPFLKKYQFSINQESKTINFYKKIKNFKEKEERINIINLLLIICLFLIFLILLIISIYNGIKLINNNKRKKRKNEIDESFDYIINDDKKDKNKILNE